MPRYPFPATPDGWYGLCLSDELPVGGVAPLRYFGRELVAFRGEDGGARVFAAHCPHLGAHLGIGGKVEGDGIRCPFHGWRYDGAGCLVEVPRLAGRLPAVRVHIQDMSENILDRAHFLRVHDMQPPDREHFEARFDGPTMVVEQLLKVTAASAAGVEVLSRTTNCGPGVSVTEVQQGPLQMVNYITQTPIDDEQTDVRLHFSMKRLPDDAATRAVAEINDRITNEQFEQDVPIWENRAYLEKPRLTENDGPVAQYRRWFRQFYSDWQRDASQEDS
jgi:nitrite reductase/ring-hydroxylating ferredoxin subunit